MNDPVKPGWQTTEFWLALISQLVGLLVLFGLVDMESAEPLKEALGGFVLAVFALVAVLPQVVTAVYVYGRSKVKASR